jgi:YXWGXW repeat-containing protein
VKTANSIRALLLVLTFGLLPAAGFAQASDNQTSDSPALDNQAPDNLAPNYQTPQNQAPDNMAPDYQTSQNLAPDDEVSVADSPPPPLPAYEQPPVPGPGYLWTPGYWAYGVEPGYYWVPGTWVLPPTFGVLWTPGYWGWGDGLFIFHRGYWGPRIGFYGGINYGCGYFGVGFAGGYWRDREFFYNRAVTNIRNTSITNVYNTTVVNRFGNSRVSHNGGPGGVNLRASAGELAAARGVHYAPTSEQRNHEWAAHGVPALRASVNHGQPSIAATARPGVFAGQSRSAAQSTHPQGRTVQGAVGSQSRGASTNNRTTDRPPWAYRSAAHDTGRVNSAPSQQFQRSRPSIAPAAAYRPAPAVRTGDFQRSQGNTRPAASRPTYQAAVGSMRTARQGYEYPRAARQPAAHWSAPARPAPSSPYAQHAARAPTYAAFAPKPARESARAPAYSAPRAPANSGPATSAARAGTQSASHGARHG